MSFNISVIKTFIICIRIEPIEYFDVGRLGAKIDFEWRHIATHVVFAIVIACVAAVTARVPMAIVGPTARCSQALIAEG